MFRALVIWWHNRKNRSVCNLLKMWWAEYEPTISETTAHKKCLLIKKHINPFIGGIPVRKLRAKHLEYLTNETLCTQLECRKILNPALNWAVKNKWCRKNIMHGIKKPDYRQKETEIYEPEEVERLLAYLTGRWLWLPVYLSLWTGMRKGEVCGLQWSDIDFEHSFLSVRRSLVSVSPHDIFIHPPKTKKSTRRIDLDKDTMEVLRRKKATAKTKWVCEAPRRSGGMPNPWNITKMLTDACRAAGIPHHTFHALRHTHATMLLAMEVHPKVVAERLGHSKTDVTLETYSHMVPTIQRSAVAALEAISKAHDR